MQLPEGWEMWPLPAKQRLLAAVQRESWVDVWGASARRAQQVPRGLWFAWLILAGRGFGKTRPGSEWSWRKAYAMPKSRGALVAPTKADVRDVMVEGESGILNVCPQWFMPEYTPSTRRLTYPNGSIQTTYSADEPDRLRGPQHHYGWVDEWAAMRRGETLMDMLDLGLRLGKHPQKMVTTTPRPLKHLRELMERDGSVVTGGSTYENLANLAPTFQQQVLTKYEGTRLGRQELHAEILLDIEGALWTHALIEEARIHELADDSVGRVVVGVDPALTHNEDSDETGILVCGNYGVGAVQEFVVLEDLSGRYSPHEWATRAAAAADKWGATVVAERNAGGDLVETTLRQSAPGARYRGVWASKSKRIRAEPVAALYEQKRVHHLGVHEFLEDQMTSWVPDKPNEKSPDRVDGLVHAITDLARRDIAPATQVKT